MKTEQWRSLLDSAPFSSDEVLAPHQEIEADYRMGDKEDEVPLSFPQKVSSLLRWSAVGRDCKDSGKRLVFNFWRRVACDILVSFDNSFIRAHSWHFYFNSIVDSLWKS